MKHENPTVNYVPRNPLWDIFMSRANASALHIITRPLSHHNLVTNRFM